MSLPNQLIKSFEAIQTLPLLQGNVSNESVQSFVKELNFAIPSPLNPVSFAIYRFNRTKYLRDKVRFVSEINTFSPYDAMILWTDFKDILQHFGLEGKIFLGWDKINKRYRGFPLAEEAATPKVEDSPPKQLPSAIDSFEEVEDEMTRIYDYMQQRLAGIL